MLTRLQVDGFKNLVNVDVRFGPFTCIAGPNGVGKSNLFDAIRFLSHLSSRSLTEAVALVRDERRVSDVRSIFHRIGDEYAQKMTLAAEMIVPSHQVDDLGQEAKATTTFLRYEIELGWRLDPANNSPVLEIHREHLGHLKLSSASQHLLFPHRAATWRNSVLKGARRGPPFISTGDENGVTVIKRHQDGGSRGHPMPSLARTLPRTVLSVATAAEAPTVLCARREMESWILLQLEPSALRKPDEINAPPRLTAAGAGLPAALYHIGISSGDPDATYARVANRLAGLITDVRAVSVDRDDKRELLTLNLTGRDGTTHAARALSDGTLRFLALAVIEIDRSASGVLCLEEPENGIHPDRIPAILELLRDIASDTDDAAGPDNPLRQIILNTHSPLVVGECSDDALLVARLIEGVKTGRRFSRVTFASLPKTWRDPVPNQEFVSRGQLLAYLQPQCLQFLSPEQPPARSRRKVRDRDDVHQLWLQYEGRVAEHGN
ncbi:MAG: ATPase [Opitutus sp.]|nr:ATPase [Opitutus sp.]